MFNFIQRRGEGAEIKADGLSFIGGVLDAAGFTVNGEPIASGHVVNEKQIPNVNNNALSKVIEPADPDTVGLVIGGRASNSSATLGSQWNDNGTLQYGPSLLFSHYYADPTNGAMITARTRSGSYKVSLGHSSAQFWNGNFASNVYASNVSFRNSYGVTLQI